MKNPTIRVSQMTLLGQISKNRLAVLAQGKHIFLKKKTLGVARKFPKTVLVRAGDLNQKTFTQLIHRVP